MAKQHIDNGIVFKEYGTGLKVMGFLDKNDSRVALIIPDFLFISQNGQLVKWYVQYIAKQAFENNCHIHTIKLPKSLRDVEVAAFRNCANLKTVVASFSGWTNDTINIYKQAFSCCPQLELVDFSRPITWLCQDAFLDCPNLRQMKSPILDISKNAFGSCKLETLIFCHKCRIHTNSIEQSNVKELVFQGELEYMTQKTFRWLKTSNVKICCNDDSGLQNLAYEGVPVEIIVPF